MNLPDLADATSADVFSAIRRKLRRSPLSADPVDVAMSVAGPVIDAQAREIRRLRAALDAAVEDSAT